MKKIVLSLVILASANSAHAMMAGGAAVSAGFAALSVSAGLSLSQDGWNKIIVNAKDDAQLFVATKGQMRGSQFEQAIKMIRENKPNLAEISDEQLALEILNY